ncbi:hypothetical protein HYV73_00500 [Candidatus Uhrbacteria bacterium]|nr:hypothetical protein [Candidatus Uhrbacteria bacterium]
MHSRLRSSVPEISRSSLPEFRHARLAGSGYDDGRRMKMVDTPCFRLAGPWPHMKFSDDPLRRKIMVTTEGWKQ